MRLFYTLNNSSQYSNALRVCGMKKLLAVSGWLIALFPLFPYSPFPLFPLQSNSL